MTIFDLRPYSYWKERWQHAFGLWKRGVGDTPRTALRLKVYQECSLRDQSMIVELRSALADAQAHASEMGRLRAEADGRVAEATRLLEQAQDENLRLQALLGMSLATIEQAAEMPNGRDYVEGCKP